MSWASDAIMILKEGRTVSFRPRGRSMEPLIMNGQLCTVEPVNVNDVNINDIVLCRVAGSDYLHKVLAIEKSDMTFMIGNNKGGRNGWTKHIFGRLIKVSP